MCTIELRSASGASIGAATALLTAEKASPVRSASAAARWCVSHSLASAGTRSPVAEDDQVAGDEIRGEDPSLDAVAEDQGAGRGDLPEPRQGPLRPVLLDEAERRVDDDDGEDHGRIQRVPQQDAADEGGREQEEYQGVGELTGDQAERAGPGHVLDRVPAPGRESRRGLPSGES
jgi:hypothetical protein